MPKLLERKPDTSSDQIRDRKKKLSRNKIALAFAAALSAAAPMKQTHAAEFGDGGNWGGNWERPAAPDTSGSPLEAGLSEVAVTADGVIDPCTDPEEKEKDKGHVWLEGRGPDVPNGNCHKAYIRYPFELTDGPKIGVITTTGDSGGDYMYRLLRKKRETEVGLPDVYLIQIKRTGYCEGKKRKKLDGQLYCSSGNNNNWMIQGNQLEEKFIENNNAWKITIIIDRCDNNL